jgi:hypothetical protein
MPNMFKCTLASGGALVLTVTCDSAFAGQTITCTDGITTLTQICPSASPYTVKFRIPNSGTWTISSGTDSTSVVITDAIELHYIPNGSTITPTDDIQTWLHCANIFDKTYTTISDVLADGTTVTALIASSNAVDYMARSNTWASSVTNDSSAMTKIGLNDYCADTLLSDSTWLAAICNSTYFESVLNVKVPTMTSATAPSGAVTTGYYKDPYKAFDGNDTTTTYVNTENTYPWITYMFTQAVKIYKMLVKTTNCNKTFSITIKGSNDNSNWTDIYSYNESGNTTSNHVFNSANNYKYYKYNVNDKKTSGYNVEIATLQYYGRAAS